MNKTMLGAFVVCAVVLVGVNTASRAAEPLEAGLAARDITPDTGYGHYRGESTGVNDPLQAKALVLRQGDETAALIMCDIIVVPRALSKRIRSRVAEETGIPFEHIGVAATHTHTGPSFSGELRDYVEADEAGELTEELEQGYVAALIEQAAGAAIDAHAEAASVSLELVRGEEDGVSFNRRFLMKNGTVRFNPGQLNPDIVRPVGPIDPEALTVLFRGEDGEAQGALTNFANHLDTVGGTEYSADYPHHIEQVLQEEFGPAFLSLFGLGASGDINHIDVNSEDRLSTQEIGEAVGETIRANLDEGTGLSPALTVESRTLFLSLQDYTEDELEWAQAYPEDDLYPQERSFLQQRRAKKILSLHDAREDEAVYRLGNVIPPAASGEPWVLAVEIQAIGLSPDTAIVTMPGEVFVELGLDLKERSPFSHTMLIELANANIAYVPTEEAFRQGDYEAINSRLAPGGGEAMIDGAVEMLHALHDRLDADL